MMDVACSTRCFYPDPLEQALRQIADMEFARVELAIAPTGTCITLDQLVNDPNSILQQIRLGPTLGFCALEVVTQGDVEAQCAQIDAASTFAKPFSASILVLHAADRKQPRELEFDRLSRLFMTASLHGMVVTVANRIGTWTDTVEDTLAICAAVPGLGVTLDPTHLICAAGSEKSFDALYPHVRHVHLRDSGKRPQDLQVKVGRGVVDFSRIINTLEHHHYQGSLVVTLDPVWSSEEMDPKAEARKMRLLLESLI